MINTYLEVLKKYAAFGGRASRSEYWLFFLGNIVVGILLGLPLGLLKGFAHIDLTIIPNLFSLAILCPSIAVGVRRLHDTDRSGFWLLLALIPFIGPIVLLVFFCLDGSQGSNRFGSRA